MSKIYAKILKVEIKSVAISDYFKKVIAKKLMKMLSCRLVLVSNRMMEKPLIIVQGSLTSNPA